MMRCLLVFSLLIGPAFSYAQKDSASSDKHFIFTYDNDFFNATDRYYTQGIILSFVHPLVRQSPVSYLLLKFRKADKNKYGMHLEQDVYTSRSIRYKGGAVYLNERPFTAVLFLTHSLQSIKEKSKLLLFSRLDIGILGPAALGEQEQKAIHKALDNIEPLGWENQLSQDIVVNYNTRIEKGLLIKRRFELLGFAAGRLGTLFTDGGGGLVFRAGIMDPYFHHGGFNSYRRGSSWKIHLNAKAEVRAIAYNATLQGGLFNRQNIYVLPEELISRVVANLSAGITITFKKVSFEYSRSYITPEFTTGLEHGWGRCAIYFNL